jgi:hypothetical protein
MIRTAQLGTMVVGEAHGESGWDRFGQAGVADVSGEVPARPL